MDEAEQIKGSPGVQEERPAKRGDPAGQPEASDAAGRRTGLRRRIARSRAQIVGIQRNRRRKAAAVDGERRRGSRHAIVEKRDIWYRGPLSYRHLMILGWLCIILHQAGFVLGGAAEGTGWLASAGSAVRPYILPLLLLANFSHILSAKQEFRTLLLKFGGLSVLVGLALPVVYGRYVMGLAGAADQLSAGLGGQFLQHVRNQVFRNGYLSYNIFVDLFLCTLFLFFLTYHFRQPVRRGRLIGFRLLSILPVAYELACIVLKTMCKNGSITLPLYVSPFLTTKPPLMFVAFIALALFIKRRERIFLRNGRSYAEYGRYLETNANSLHFSVYTFVIFIAAAAIDLLLLLGTISMRSSDLMAAVELSEQMLEGGEMMTATMSRVIHLAEAAGIGESIDLFFVAPLVLLYSYTRKHKDPLIDMAIPMAGAAAVALVWLEALFQAVCQAPALLNAYLQANFGFDLTQISIAELEEMLTTLIR